jgi:hypothetical protein
VSLAVRGGRIVARIFVNDNYPSITVFWKKDWSLAGVHEVDLCHLRHSVDENEFQCMVYGNVHSTNWDSIIRWRNVDVVKTASKLPPCKLNPNQPRIEARYDGGELIAQLFTNTAGYSYVNLLYRVANTDSTVELVSIMYDGIEGKKISFDGFLDFHQHTSHPKQLNLTWDIDELLGATSAEK